MINRNGQRAFTIVELIIVVSVIAILAAISAVTYSEVQQRALNVQNIQFVKAFDQALQLYAMQHGDYPPNFDWWPCLGSGGIDVNNDGLYDCQFNGTTMLSTGNAAFNNALRPYIDPESKPASFTVVNSSNVQTRGAMIWHVAGGSVDGQPHEWFMYYVLKGDVTCSYGRIVAEAGWPSFSSSPSSGYTYHEVNGRGCLIMLPDPTKL